jgi:hypothetical protein
VTGRGNPFGGRQEPEEERHVKRWGRTAFAFAALAAFSLVVPVGAGHNWGAADSSTDDILCTDQNHPQAHKSECSANGLYHQVYIFDEVPSNLETALVNSLEEDYEPVPGLTAVRVSDPLASGVDVKIYYRTVNSNWPRAWTTCDHFADYGLVNVRYHMWCQPHRIYYQAYPEANDCWNNAACRRWLACHELGHTLGLQHASRTTTCMYTVGNPDVLDSHDIEHLTDCYPKPTLPLPTFPAESRSNHCKYADQ